MGADDNEETGEDRGENLDSREGRTGVRREGEGRRTREGINRCSVERRGAEENGG